MKLLVSLFLVMISLEYCAPGTKVPANQDDHNSKPDVSEMNDMQISISVNKMLNGFNTANLFHNYSGENEALTLIKNLHPRILRFPGGTVANFYHFRDPGYGYREKDLAEVSGNMKQNATKSFQSEQRNLSAKGVNENFISKFVELAKELNAHVLIVANLLNEKDEDIIAMIKYFQDNSIPIAGIELGNEYYFKAYQNVFPDVSSYIAKARAVTTKIREFNPDIPIGVIAANSAKLKGITGPRKLRFEDWNRKLGKENFYDAYIKHIYAIHENCESNSSLETKMKCNLTSNTKFVFDDVKESFVEFEEFYGNRPVWITEWNVKDVFQNLGNTFLQGIYYADFMFLMMENSNVEIATYHNLLAKGSGFNIIGQRPKQDWPSSGRFIKRAPYEVADLLNPLFNGNYRLLMNNSERKIEIEKGVTFRMFEDSEENNQIAFLVNKSGVPFDLGALAEFIDDNNKTIILRSIGATSLDKGIGVNEWNNEGMVEQQEMTIKGLQGNFVEGYSVNRITFD